ncbi:MAG TPA: protein kinase, partial [Polyangiaceae bacterium]|nr:protein kinase [Polyangiaceae bacterium]
MIRSFVVRMDPDSLVGRTLVGRFRVDRILGRGGMATVFAARDERDGRDVALKVLKRELTRDPMVLRRFEREAKAASHLSHPNIIKVYDFGVEGGDAFISMELANGVDLLKALSRERPMRQARSVLLLAQVCAALSVAHKKGIIHRDLKPENVVLVPEPSEPGGERAKVLDFGIAKVLDVSPKGGAGGDANDPPSYVTKTALTRVGTIVGTPAYMSPEQCRGGEVDGRSDVYACGILLYQLVTGELPFTGETPLHTAMRHIHAQPRRPSELRADLHPALEKTILKALAKWPGERHQSAEALREELLGLLPELPDRATDLVLPDGFGGGPPSPRAAPEPTRHLVGGPLGSTPLRAVRLGGLAAPEPEAPITETSSKAAEDDDDDEPRTFLIKAEDAESSALSAEPVTDPAPGTAAEPTTATPQASVPQVKTDPLAARSAMRGNTSAPRPPAASVTDVAADTPRAAPPGRGAPVEVRTAPLARAATPSQPELADAKAPLAQDAAAAPRAAARPRTLASAKSIGTTQRGPAAAPAPSTAQAASASPPSAPRGALGGAALGSIALGSATTNAPTTPRAEAPRRPKQTETGLTPTSPKGRAPITTPPVAATPAPKPTAPSEPPPRAPQIDDDDEPSTNIRDVTGVGKNPLLQTPDARVHRTLVMEETKARQQAAEILGVAVASPAMGPNAMAQAGRAPTALPHGMHGGHG